MKDFKFGVISWGRICTTKAETGLSSYNSQLYIHFLKHMAFENGLKVANTLMLILTEPAYNLLVFNRMIGGVLMAKIMKWLIDANQD